MITAQILKEEKINGENIWKCARNETCKKTSKSLRSAIIHYNKEHLYKDKEKNRNANCPYCPKIFSEMKNLHIHINLKGETKNIGSRVARCEFIPEEDNPPTRWEKAEKEIRKKLQDNNAHKENEPQIENIQPITDTR